jgi:hypothetical protein
MERVSALSRRGGSSPQAAKQGKKEEREDWAVSRACCTTSSTSGSFMLSPISQCTGISRSQREYSVAMISVNVRRPRNVARPGTSRSNPSHDGERCPLYFFFNVIM